MLPSATMPSARGAKKGAKNSAAFVSDIGCEIEFVVL